MKQQKLILIGILIITSFPLTGSANRSSLELSEIQEKNISLQRGVLPKYSKDKKKTYKELKTAIKQAKKYHKSLIGLYIQSFDPQLLESLRDNALLIQNLKQAYKAKKPYIS